MENASKALLMAAGMFLAVLIISLLVALYNQISDYYNQQHEFTVMEQAQEFNAKFEAYNKDNLIGIDLLSFMNMVIDYNTNQSYQDGTNYERIKVTITLGNEDILEQFKGESSKYSTTSVNKYLTSTITNTTGTGNDWQNDKNLIAIANTPNDLIEDAKNYYINDLTEAKLQKLSAEIDNIIVSETGTTAYDEYCRLKRASILQKILGLNIGSSNDCDIKVDNETGKTLKDPNNTIEGIKNITSQYHQYNQFKKAYFDCTEMKYDTDTNRVVEVNFKLQVKDGTVVFK